MLRADKPVIGDLSRRSVLRAGAVVGGGLLIGINLVSRAAADAGGTSAEGPAFNAFIRISPEDRVTFVMPAVEMGQGAYTSTSMMLAEELDVDLDHVMTEHAPPDQKLYGSPALVIQATGGSTTTAAWFLPLRKAGATARAMLVQAAAAGWGVAPDTLRTQSGMVHHDASGRSISYGKLAGHAAHLAPPTDVPLKDPSRFRLLGKPARRLDSPGKVDGSAKFGIDVTMPGLRFATLAASPVFGGKLKHVDDTQAKVVPGVRQIVVLDDLVAVVADHMWAAKQGLDALKLDWDEGANAGVGQDQLWAELEKGSLGSGVVAEKVGDAAQALSTGTLYEATYELPFLAHAPMEPMNCTAHVHDGLCEVWVGTQAPGLAQGGAAKALSIAPDKVTINNHLIGGGFGRRLEVDGVVKAVRIAQQVEGPVKVVWTREEDIQQELYRPLYHDRMKARVEDGKVTAWHHRVTGPSILARWLPPAFKDGIDSDGVDGAIKQPYDFPNTLVEFVRHETQIPVAFWRGVGPNSNVFSAECFLDLIARQSSADPVAFRRAMLQKNKRALGALDLAADKAGWSTPLAASAGGRVGRGFALLASFGSFLGCVAEVVVGDDGDVRVTRVVVAADVGTVVNPDTLLAQIEGGVVFGITTILHSKVTIDKGRVQQSNFNDYRLLRIDEMPVIAAHIVPSSEPPGGIGEPGTVVVQPAIANAIFAATGTQLTRMPIDRSKLAKGAA
ncbi:molybdopterin cofactor-binding domain-containing protein [Novosphingobium sp.]|uniref:xanthine dehydrogenase family protein molybdopterin-binding subunit n=1 Tax=Novosphingobium sp. TaxID=1874826 RepID=UPI0031DD73A3